MTLRHFFHLAAQGQTDGWLFLPGEPAQWKPDSEAWLVDLDALAPDPETGEPMLPPEMVAKGLRETLDMGTIAQCIQWADRLAGRADDNVRFESFRYYFRFDAFLPRIGAPDPPPWEEIKRKRDLDFYDKLGPENLACRCRRENCSRGAIKDGVLCRRHHFEMIRHYDCPFDH